MSVSADRQQTIQALTEYRSDQQTHVYFPTMHTTAISTQEILFHVYGTITNPVKAFVLSSYTFDLTPPWIFHKVPPRSET